MKPLITLSLGGSVINPGNIDRKFLEDFSVAIKELVHQYKFMIVCGGGKVARQYISGLPDGLTEGERDYMGIAATWLNAQLLTYYFKGYCSPILPTTVKKLTEDLQTHDVGISGGFLTAIKTDEDAAILADLYGSPILVNVTNVDGIYDKDPKQYSDAKKYEELTYNEFYEIVSPLSLSAGSNAPFTLIAAKICERTNIRIIVVEKAVDKIKQAINGKTVGTVIQNK
ncbi:MAG: UMP kinase [Candidatus Heimdallarchaeota archaeon]|nr:MAG: UMP kinase [Candidatus Heimdallarchaeota archaeon]